MHAILPTLRIPMRLVVLLLCLLALHHLIRHHYRFLLGDKILFKQEFLIIAFIFLQNVIQVYLMSYDLLRIGLMIDSIGCSIGILFLWLRLLIILVIPTSYRF